MVLKLGSFASNRHPISPSKATFIRNLSYGQSVFTAYSVFKGVYSFKQCFLRVSAYGNIFFSSQSSSQFFPLL